jgi:hypothetical protein
MLTVGHTLPARLRFFDISFGRLGLFSCNHRDLLWFTELKRINTPGLISNDGSKAVLYLCAAIF